MNGDWHKLLDDAMKKYTDDDSYKTSSDPYKLNEIKQLLGTYKSIFDEWSEDSLTNLMDESTPNKNVDEVKQELDNKQRMWLLTVYNDPIDNLTELQITTIKEVLDNNSYTYGEKIILDTVRESYIREKDKRKTEVRSDFIYSKTNEVS